MGETTSPSFDAGEPTTADESGGGLSGDVSIEPPESSAKDGQLSEAATEPRDVVPDEADGFMPGTPPCSTCSMYGTPTAVGLVPSKLPELSGLAASIRHPHTLYAHNDSGDSARFFAISDHAELQAEIDLVGATATDWEDIAVGPCPSGSCVYLGDIGDNNSRRTQYTIYRVAEPDAWPTDGGSLTPSFERFPFVYPDGSHNAETLMVHPATGRIFVVTKNTGVSGRVYELPLPLTPNVVATLVFITFVSLPPSAGLITSGKFHPCAERMLLRTYGGLYEFLRPPGASLEDIFTANPVAVPVAVETQGEAVTYSFDGKGYVTSSETVSGSPPAVVNLVPCLQ